MHRKVGIVAAVALTAVMGGWLLTVGAGGLRSAPADAGSADGSQAVLDVSQESTSPAVLDTGHVEQSGPADSSQWHDDDDHGGDHEGHYDDDDGDHEGHHDDGEERWEHGEEHDD